MQKVWKIATREKEDLIEQLLYNRGVESGEEKEKFYNPQISDYQKLVDISNIPIALKRIKKAIEDKELIVVYGDYDVDGITASTIMYRGLSSMGARIIPYIPHREKEGYGMSKIGLDNVRDLGASLVITVDNGIVAFEQAEYCKQLGMDLIITDHHLAHENGKLPESLTLVHSTEMCGAAVAWCLIQRELSEKLRDELLQFVAIATVADMIPLTGLGRAFVSEGLKVLNKTKNPGLLALFREAKLELGKIRGYEIGHAIGPRLNAIGRLEHAIDAVRLLCTENEKRARDLARLLQETNDKRKDFTTIAVDEALLSIKGNGQKKIHIVHSETFLPGVIGLIAARICQETSRPSIAISVGETISKGSARSVDGVNIAETIRSCSDILVDVGGHKGAAGFSILKENIPQFIARMEKLLEELPDEVEQVIEIEAEVERKQLTKNLVKEINKFEPFGHHNPQPVLAVRSFQISDMRTLSEGKHLKFKADGIDCIAFGKGDLINVLEQGSFVDIAFYLEINEFRGQENLQLMVKDIKQS